MHDHPVPPELSSPKFQSVVPTVASRLSPMPVLGLTALHRRIGNLQASQDPLASVPLKEAC